LGSLKGGDHAEGLSFDGKIALEWILGTGWEGVDWMHVAGDRDHWFEIFARLMGCHCMKLEYHLCNDSYRHMCYVTNATTSWRN